MSETGASGPWTPLSLKERRVLGVLVEKQKTAGSADTYPLTLNGLVTGCNQKSNRDPILNLTDLDVEETLEACLRKHLVQRVTGSRVERWRHLLYESWHVSKLDLAILAELLLRGPQTLGELRPRVSRMDPIDDLEALKAALRPLAERKLIVYLTPEDRRGAMVTHGFHEPRELEAIRTRVAALPTGEPLTPIAGLPEPSRPTAPAIPHLEEKLADLTRSTDEVKSEIAALKQEIADLHTQIANLRKDLQTLRQALGA